MGILVLTVNTCKHTLPLHCLMLILRSFLLDSFFALAVY